MTIRYARSGRHHIAYETRGDGLHLLYLPGYILPIDSLDEEPHVARYYRRLASFARVIHFDARGVGLSDPVDAEYTNTPAGMARDALAVLDAVGCEQVAVVAWGSNGTVGIELAAAYPDRVSALVLGNTYARLLAAPDYPEGVPTEIIEGFLEQNADPDAQWELEGSDDVSLFAPSLSGDAGFRDWVSRASRRAASPASARAYLELTIRADAREHLPNVYAPTLVLHTADNRFTPRYLGRYVASHIEGAKFVLLPGADHMPWTAIADPVLDEVEEFLTGQRHGSADRVLTTVAFTDIVDSTTRASALGDVAWRSALDTHDAIVRAQLDRFGGHEVNTTGDGFVATFDLPTIAVRAALAIVDATRAAGTSVRVGVHTGECERRGNDIAGFAVHVAARVGAQAGAGEVLVSRTVADIISGSGLVLESRGPFALKGLPQSWELFAVRP